MGGGVWLCVVGAGAGSKAGCQSVGSASPPWFDQVWSPWHSALWDVSPRPLRTVTAWHAGVANVPLYLVCAVPVFFFLHGMAWDGTGKTGLAGEPLPAERKRGRRPGDQSIPRTPCGNDLKASSHSHAGSFFFFLNPHEVIGKSLPPPTPHLVCRPPPTAAALPACYMPGGCWTDFDITRFRPKWTHRSLLVFSNMSSRGQGSIMTSLFLYR